MADFPMNGAGAPSEQSQSLGTFASYAGAVASLALMVGIGVWGYGVLSRDVSGVPVVRAAGEGPMRVAPEDPGGASAAHQGLAVNTVMAEGGAEGAAERVVLAPQPVELTEEDQPMGEAMVPPAAVTQAEAEGEAVELTPQMSSIQALAEQLSAGVAPLGGVEAEAEPTNASVVLPADPVNLPAESVQSEPVTATPAKVKAGPLTLRPRVRPAALKTSLPVEAPQPAAAAVAVSVPAGTRLVQLGAFDSEDVARREWERLSGRFGDYLDGKTRVVQRAKSGGRVFYRLRAMGFADLSDARRFCAALVAERADCIPVVQK